MLFPKIAVGAPDGAESERSSYEHLLVIYLEYQGDKIFLGDAKAADVMTFWSTDHYRQLYKLVLASEKIIGEVVVKHGLNCCPASLRS